MRILFLLDASIQPRTTTIKFALSPCTETIIITYYYIIITIIITVEIHLSTFGKCRYEKITYWYTGIFPSRIRVLKIPADPSSGPGAVRADQSRPRVFRPAIALLHVPCGDSVLKQIPIIGNHNFPGTCFSVRVRRSRILLSSST